MDENMVYCENLVKIYKTADIEVVALQGLDLEVKKGELMALIGNSGSGKSTLLNIIGGLDKPSAGRIEVAGQDLLRFTEKDLIQYRREIAGFVWQNNARNLIPYLSALENVEMPMILSKRPGRKQRAKELLDLLGLTSRMHSRLEELSGGEQQRVAIAIGLANEPKLLLADEPTGNVDTKTTDSVFRAFRDVNKELQQTVIIVTHDRRISWAVDRVVAIRDGRTSSELIRKESYVAEMEELPDTLDYEEETHEELAVLDRAGRLQIPREYLDAIGVFGKDKVKVLIEDDKIVLIRPEKQNAEQ